MFQGNSPKHLLAPVGRGPSYWLMEEVGGGAYGRVYRAIELRPKADNEAKVALKLFLSQSVIHPESGTPRTVPAEQWRDREADPLRTATHSARDQQRKDAEYRPRFSQYRLHGEGHHDGKVVAFLAMDWAEGEPLRVAAENARGDQLFAHARAAFEALDSLHVLGLSHNDLNPGNCLIATMPDGGKQCTLIDLGAARDMQADGTATFMGSNPYLPPEWARATKSGQVTPHYDQWHILVFVFQKEYSLHPFVTLKSHGHEPYDGTYLAGLARQERHAEALDHTIRTLKATGLAENAQQFWRKAFAFAPEARHPSTAALLDGLEEALTGRRRKPVPLPTPPPPPLPRPRMRYDLAMYVLAALSLGALGITAWVKRSPESPGEPPGEQVEKSLGEWQVLSGDPTAPLSVSMRRGEGVAELALRNNVTVPLSAIAEFDIGGTPVVWRSAEIAPGEFAETSYAVQEGHPLKLVAVCPAPNRAEN